jgi:hypothetical protein
MGLLRSLSALYLLQIAALLRSAEGTYTFFVELQSFSNPGDRDHDGGCCEIGCGSCDNYFIVCLRQDGFDENSHSCPYGGFSTSANPVSESSFQFSTGANALATGIRNPYRFNGNIWPVSR